MNNFNIILKQQMADRLTGLSKWNNTSPEMMAKLLLEEALREVWQTHGSEISEMQKGLEHFHNL